MALYYIRENSIVTLEKEEKVVILSPSLYWYAHAEFPTTSLAKARKLADAFLDSRPDSYRTIYVEKRGNGFDCYAFDADALGIRLDEIEANDAPCFFLQQFSEEMPLRIDSHLIADAINGICIELKDENRTLPTLDSVDLYAVAKPFNRTKSGRIPNGWMVALLVILSITMMMDLALRFQKERALQTASEKVRSERSIYEVKSLISRYQKRAGEQAKLRKAIKKALRGRIIKIECSPSKGCSRE
ncbi:hypothetical protein [Hydrogenimonas sp.]|uniref:hypothetical protein n=1 Tax=Hydrogenimonas sp. TaxID=2231112 RepID=UPI002632DE06|nr:hypothetical protein [Hydrogenimonas sp.]